MPIYCLSVDIGMATACERRWDAEGVAFELVGAGEYTFGSEDDRDDAARFAAGPLCPIRYEYEPADD
jgi:hypothetical protein